MESRARDQARWLLGDHGDDAEDVLRAKLKRKQATDADRYRFKLTLREVARLRRVERDKYGRGQAAWRDRVDPESVTLKSSGWHAAAAGRR